MLFCFVIIHSSIYKVAISIRRATIYELANKAREEELNAEDDSQERQVEERLLRDTAPLKTVRLLGDR